MTDGATVASANAGRSMNFDTHPLLLGADIDNGVPGNFLNGQIDEASIDDRALGADEIASIYNVGSSGKRIASLNLPVLHMELVSSATARIYWSTNYPLYQLQYNSRLDTTNWAASGLAPAITGPNFVVTNSLFEAQRLLSLKRIARALNAASTHTKHLGQLDDLEILEVWSP